VSRAPDAPVVAAEARPPTRAAPALALVAVAGPEAVRTPVANVVVESTSPANRAAAPPTVANVERGSRAEPPVATVASTPMREAPPVANAPPLPSAPVTAAVPRAEQVAMASAPITTVLPPATAEIEALFATFVEAYERGRADTFAALFGEDADADHRHGRAAIRGEYGELFRQSEWRKMQLTRVNWRQVGDRAFAKGEITVRIGWRDGREVEQRVALDMEIVRLDGRVVIARLSQQPKN
jgi:ketosteroid isomerase-like protein